MANNKSSEDRPGIMGSFIGGLVFTLLLVVVVPVVSDAIIRPQVVQLVGDNAFMWFSSSLIVTIIMLVVLLLFTMFLGGGAILKRFGIVGVVALIVAYYLMGNLSGAIMPVAVLIIMYVFRVVRDRK